MVTGISRTALTISPKSKCLAVFKRSRSCAEGGYSLVVKTVNRTALIKATAPTVKDTRTNSGMALPLPAPPGGSTRCNSKGRYEAATLPTPIKKLCMVNPRARCSSGSMSATKARNGSMLILMEASRIQRRPAAIHNAELNGMRTRAHELRIAPVRKKGRRLPKGPQVLSLQCPIIGCTSKPVSGAASQSSGNWSG